MISSGMYLESLFARRQEQVQQIVPPAALASLSKKIKNKPVYTVTPARVRRNHPRLVAAQPANPANTSRPLLNSSRTSSRCWSLL